MDLQLVRKINGLVTRHIGLSFFMDFIARFGHLFFVAYGLWLWLGGREESRGARRRCALSALAGVLLCSAISFGIGKIWRRPRPFAADRQIWNFTGHKANASFPSNHTMNACVIVLSLFKYRMPGRFCMAVMAALLAFSRIFAGIHYPTDIIGGAGIALAVHTLQGRSRGLSRLIGRAAAFSLWADEAVRRVRHIR